MAMSKSQMRRVTAQQVKPDPLKALQEENTKKALTVALGSAVQPFIKSVPLDKWKAVTDAYAAIPEDIS